MEIVDGKVQLLVDLEIEESESETNQESEYNMMSITVFNKAHLDALCLH